eukprot:TRINITY_DN5270_c0_g1_i1.p1 TRINITY_DN5270_c0_g1~~TRINITY_DN5270_c0_g1_i1.p1  ORF type:complete len:970 (+),score=267.96 TRINITY_DN5270_c0_g1_i1:27-2912(+)
MEGKPRSAQSSPRSSLPRKLERNWKDSLDLLTPSLSSFSLGKNAATSDVNMKRSSSSGDFVNRPAVSRAQPSMKRDLDECLPLVMSSFRIIIPETPDDYLDMRNFDREMITKIRTRDYAIQGELFKFYFIVRAHPRLRHEGLANSTASITSDAEWGNNDLSSQPETVDERLFSECFSSCLLDIEISEKVDRSDDADPGVTPARQKSKYHQLIADSLCPHRFHIEHEPEQIPLNQSTNTKVTSPPPKEPAPTSRMFRDADGNLSIIYELQFYIGVRKDILDRQMSLRVVVTPASYFQLENEDEELNFLLNPNYVEKMPPSRPALCPLTVILPFDSEVSSCQTGGGTAGCVSVKNTQKVTNWELLVEDIQITFFESPAKNPSKRGRSNTNPNIPNLQIQDDSQLGNSGNYDQEPSPRLSLDTNRPVLSAVLAGVRDLGVSSRMSLGDPPKSIRHSGESSRSMDGTNPKWAEAQNLASSGELEPGNGPRSLVQARELNEPKIATANLSDFFKVTLPKDEIPVKLIVGEEQSFGVFLEPLPPKMAIKLENFGCKVVLIWKVGCIQGNIMSSFTINLPEPHFEELVLSIDPSSPVPGNVIFPAKITISNLGTKTRDLTLIMGSAPRVHKSKKISQRRTHRRTTSNASASSYATSVSMSSDETHPEVTEFTEIAFRSPLEIADEMNLSQPAILALEKSLYLGRLKPGGTVTTTLKLIGLREGLCSLEPIMVHDDTTEKSLVAKDLCQIYVKDVKELDPDDVEMVMPWRDADAPKPVIVEDHENLVQQSPMMEERGPVHVELKLKELTVIHQIKEIAEERKDEMRDDDDGNVKVEDGEKKMEEGDGGLMEGDGGMLGVDSPLITHTPEIGRNLMDDVEPMTSVTVSISSPSGIIDPFEAPIIHGTIPTIVIQPDVQLVDATHEVEIENVDVAPLQDGLESKPLIEISHDELTPSRDQGEDEPFSPVQL